MRELIFRGKYYYWLVVSTPLKNISQLGSLFQILGEKNVPNHQQAMFFYDRLGEGDLGASLHRLARDRGCFITMANIEDTKGGHKLLYVNGFPNASQKLAIWTSDVYNVGQGQPLETLAFVVSKTHALASTSEQELLPDVHLQPARCFLARVL